MKGEQKRIMEEKLEEKQEGKREKKEKESGRVDVAIARTHLQPYSQAVLDCSLRHHIHRTVIKRIETVHCVRSCNEM